MAGSDTSQPQKTRGCCVSKTKAVVRWSNHRVLHTQRADAVVGVHAAVLRKPILSCSGQSTSAARVGETECRSDYLHIGILRKGLRAVHLDYI